MADLGPVRLLPRGGRCRYVVYLIIWAWIGLADSMQAEASVKDYSSMGEYLCALSLGFEAEVDTVAS